MTSSSKSPADSHYKRALWAVITLGVVVRLVLAFTTDGIPYDLEAFRLVSNALVTAPSRVYALVNDGPGYPRWPYPPGYFVIILATRGVRNLTELDFLSLMRIPPIAADAAIGWVIQDFLGWRGVDHRSRLAAAGLVVLGPSFVVISGFHGQFDSVAILPAVVALAFWERTENRRRPVVVGALIGVASAVKTVPLLMLLALLPSSRSRGEGITLLASAAVAPILIGFPVLLTEGTGWLRVLRYNGVPGLGGISLVAQPALALDWLGVGHAQLSSVSQALFDGSHLITVTALLLAGTLLLRYRASAALAAVVVWLTVYVFGVNFFMQYMVWGIPFFLLAGYVRAVFVLETVLLAPVLVLYLGTSHPWLAKVFYVSPMLTVWAIMAIVLVLVTRRLVAGTGGTVAATTSDDAWK